MNTRDSIVFLALLVVVAALLILSPFIVLTMMGIHP